MKIGENIIYMGEKNRFFTQNKRYKIIDLGYYFVEKEKYKQPFIFFYNNLNELEWIRINRFKKHEFITENEFRKIKLDKLNKELF